MDLANRDYKSCTIICESNSSGLLKSISSIYEKLTYNFRMLNLTHFYDEEKWQINKVPVLQVLSSNKIYDYGDCLDNMWLNFLIAEKYSLKFEKAREAIIGYINRESSDDLPMPLLTILAKDPSIPEVKPQNELETCLLLDRDNFVRKTLQILHDLNAVWCMPKLISLDLMDYITTLCGKTVSVCIYECNTICKIKGLQDFLASHAPGFSKAEGCLSIIAFDQSVEITIAIISELAEMIMNMCNQDINIYFTDLGLGGMELNCSIRITILYY